MLVPMPRSSATSTTGFPKPTKPTAWALNSAVYRFLVTVFIVAYSFISWSRIFAHFTQPAQRLAFIVGQANFPRLPFNRIEFGDLRDDCNGVDVARLQLQRV